MWLLIFHLNWNALNFSCAASCVHSVYSQSELPTLNGDWPLFFIVHWCEHHLRPTQQPPWKHGFFFVQSLSLSRSCETSDNPYHSAILHLLTRLEIQRDKRLKQMMFHSRGCNNTWNWYCYTVNATRKKKRNNSIRKWDRISESVYNVHVHNGKWMQTNPSTKMKWMTVHWCRTHGSSFERISQFSILHETNFMN